MTVDTKANLLTRANQVRTETGGFANTASRLGGLFRDIIDSLFPQPSGLMLNDSSTGAASVNTVAIQAAIDAAHAAYLAKSGVVEVLLPEGEIWVKASVLAETYWNYGVQVLASDGCLSMRDGVLLRGQGIGKTILRPVSPTLDVIHLVDGTNLTLDGIEINGGWTASGAGHGILQVTSANTPLTAVDNLAIRNYYGHDLGSYALLNPKVRAVA